MWDKHLQKHGWGSESEGKLQTVFNCEFLERCHTWLKHIIALRCPEHIAVNSNICLVLWRFHNLFKVACVNTHPHAQTHTHTYVYIIMFLTIPRLHDVLRLEGWPLQNRNDPWYRHQRLLPGTNAINTYLFLRYWCCCKIIS